MRTKQCRSCSTGLPATEVFFTWQKDGHLSKKCRLCVREYALQREYGVTFKEMHDLLEAQKFRCAICGRHQDELSRGLAVDHCHDSGNVRGMLCSSCNSGLGLFADDVGRLVEAIRYLDRFNRS